MITLRHALFLVAAASPLVVHALAAQGVSTAALFGSVTEAEDSAIVDAVVSVTNTATGERWQTVTRSRGRYVLEYLSVGGPYAIEARAIGFSPASRTGIELSLGERRQVDLTLNAAILELPEIAVTALVDPLVNAGRTGAAQSLSDTIISRLPVRGRDFAQLVYLSPQAVLTPDDGVSIAGQSDRLNGLQIDGATNLDLTGASGGGGIGTPASNSGVRTLSVEALRELQILAAPFDVRYGTFAGGLVNAVTRSGSNRWEGSASAYFEDRALTGKDPTGERAADFSTKELALTLAGPLVHDRAAFFLDLGLQRDLTPQEVPGIRSDTAGGADSAGVGIRYASAVRFQEILRDTYGVDAGDFAAAPERRPSGNLFAKVTLQPAVNHRLELSYNFGQGKPESPGGREPYDVYALTSNGLRIPATIHATRLMWTTARDGRLANELNVGYLRVRERCEVPVQFPEVLVGADKGFLRAGASGFCGGNFANQDVLEVTDNLSWYQWHSPAHLRDPHGIDPYAPVRSRPAAGFLVRRESGRPRGRTGGILLPDPDESASARRTGAGSRYQSARLLRPGPLGGEPRADPDGRGPDGRSVLHLEPGEQSSPALGARHRQHAHAEREPALVAAGGIQPSARCRGLPAGRNRDVRRPAGVPLAQFGVRLQWTRYPVRPV